MRLRYRDGVKRPGFADLPSSAWRKGWRAEKRSPLWVASEDLAGRAWAKIAQHEVPQEEVSDSSRLTTPRKTHPSADEVGESIRVMWRAW